MTLFFVVCLLCPNSSSTSETKQMNSYILESTQAIGIHLFSIDYTAIMPTPDCSGISYFRLLLLCRFNTFGNFIIKPHSSQQNQRPKFSRHIFVFYQKRASFFFPLPKINVLYLNQIRHGQHSMFYSTAVTFITDTVGVHHIEFPIRNGGRHFIFHNLGSNSRPITWSPSFSWAIRRTSICRNCKTSKLVHLSGFRLPNITPIFSRIWLMKRRPSYFWQSPGQLSHRWLSNEPEDNMTISNFTFKFFAEQVQLLSQRYHLLR